MESYVFAPTVAALIEARAEATPDAPMLFDEYDHTLTYSQYAAAVLDMAATFTMLGVQPGDVVAWQLPTRTETVVLMGALARIGATQVPVLPIHRERELRFMIAQSRSRLLCVPGTWRGLNYVEMAERVRAELTTFDIIECAPAPVAPATPAEPAAMPPPPADGDAVRWIFYSSGTTADPKGVMHTDRSMMAAGRGMAFGQGYRPGDRYGVAFPFTHIGGLTNLCAVLSAGFALILLEVFDPPRAVEVFARHRATVVGGGPSFYRAYLEQQRRQPDRSILPKLRFMTGGGAPIPPSMHFEVRAEIGGYGCAHGYGMTETGGVLAMNRPDDTDEHLCHTVGRVLPGMEARVARPSGAAAEPAREGEIQVRGEYLLAGYVDASLDADAFDDDGWFRTGDLGSFDADGYLRVTGRIKDIIIRKGENISAKEIEDLLYAHPSIADVAVIGLPDDERGELVCAVIVPEVGAEPLDVAGVAMYLDTQQLMRQKYPERVETVSALPRNASGKVLKKDLVHTYQRAAQGEPPSP
jgi:acyl-CoA synthetase (AMP-forming)/AMP-acid ligase II